MIARATIDEILERASLTEIVSEGVQLRRQGTSTVGLCPFHSEKTPSFHIREDKFYHCFGCGVSGNAISYVMRARGLGFPDAVEEIASRLGIRVQYEGRINRQEGNKDKSALYKVNALAAAFYRVQLSAREPARDEQIVRTYLSERRISREAEEAFKIGYAPRERAALLQYLTRHKVPETLIVQAGLVRRSQRGELYDTFRARVMFPIFSDNKHIAGFGGRIVPSLVDEGVLTKAPKYLNSSDTPVYHKQSIFFGLPQAIDAIRDSREVFLVEGYLDVIGLWQVGVRNVLATCGTAVTAQHMKRLKYLTRRVILLFDGDSAGRDAAGKSFPVFLNAGLDVAASFLPHEEDPDTFALKHGAQTAVALKQLPGAALIDCYVDYLISRTGVTQASELGSASKGRLCEELAPVLKELKNTIERSDTVQRAALRLGVDGDLLSRMVDSSNATTRVRSSSSHPSGELSKQSVEKSTVKNDGSVQANANQTQARIPHVSELSRLDRTLLHALMARKEELPFTLLRDPDLVEMIHPSTLQFADALAAIVGDQERSMDSKKEEIKLLLEHFGDSWKSHWKEAYLMLEDREVDLDKVYEECRNAYWRQSRSNQLEQLERNARSASTEEERLELSQQAVQLKRKLTNRSAA